jgi:hypothetical protein
LKTAREISGALAFACGSCVRAARRRPSNLNPHRYRIYGNAQ